MLVRLLVNEKERATAIDWRADGGPETEAFLHALETGGSDPLLEKWQELRRTDANHPVPDPIEQEARRLVVLLAEALCRTGLGKGEAREQAAEAVKRIFPKKPKRRKGQPSISVDIDADAIRFWQSAYPPFTPDDEKLIAQAINRDHRYIVGWFVKRIELVIDPAAALVTRRILFGR
jgi:hypothetical protein